MELERRCEKRTSRMSQIPIKMQILRYVCEQGLVSVDDVARHLHKPECHQSIRVMMHQLGLGHQSYGNITHGIWYVRDKASFKLVRKYYPELPNFKLHRQYPAFVEHSIGMNMIRHILENDDSLNIVKWLSEECVRSIPKLVRQDLIFGHYPDAIFWRQRKSGAAQKVFVEYERSLKNKRRYVTIFRRYAGMTDIESKSVIYICDSEDIRKYLIRITKEMQAFGKLKNTRVFQFTRMEDVKLMTTFSKGGAL